jgi:hypothetical protein
VRSVIWCKTAPTGPNPPPEQPTRMLTFVIRRTLLSDVLLGILDPRIRVN